MSTLTMMLEIFSVVALSGLAIAYRAHGQRRLDRQRDSYSLTFPAELDPKLVISWLQSAWGDLETRASLIAGDRTLVLEIDATSKGMRYRMRLPWQAEAMARKLQAIIPGLRVDKDEGWLPTTWTVAGEFGETKAYLPLLIDDPKLTATNLVSSLANLTGDERVVFQVVLAPGRKKHVPEYEKKNYNSYMERMAFSWADKPKEALEAQRAKEAEHNFDAVFRVGVMAETRPRAKSLYSQVAGALRSVTGQVVGGKQNRMRQTTVLDTVPLGERIAKATSVVLPMRWPARMTTSELVALIGWPLGEMTAPGIPRGRPRYLPATEAIPRVGTVLARSNYPGHERDLALGANERTTHLYVVGATGTGKSSLLINECAQDLAAGHGLALFDMKGDLFDGVIDRVPEDRIKDVVAIDLRDKERPVGFNILRDGNAESAVSEIISLFKAMYPEMMRGGVWVNAGFLRGLQALTDYPGTAFPDIVPLLSPQWATEEEEQWRLEVAQSVSEDNATFWRKFIKERPEVQDRFAQPVIDRAGQLNERPALRNILGQSRSTFDMGDVANGRKILLVRLAGPIDREAARLLGTMLVNSLNRAAMNRTHTGRFVSIVVDEAQDLMSLPVNLDEMAAKLRSKNVGLTIAHQDLGQVRKRAPELVSGFMANLRSKILFNLSASDAGEFARELGDSTLARDISHLGTREVIMRLMTPGGVSSPLTAVTTDLPPSLGTAEAVTQASRERYGRPREEVEAEIRQRRRSKRAKGKPPKLAPESWE